MTVLDTTGAVDALIDGRAAAEVADLIRDETVLAAPDVLTFEVLSVLRRLVLRGELDPHRAEAAVEDYGTLAVMLFPTLPLRERAWALRDRLTAGDALFVALAESLGEPLATHDAPLARAAEKLGVEVIPL